MTVEQAWREFDRQWTPFVNLDQWGNRGPTHAQQVLLERAAAGWLAAAFRQSSRAFGEALRETAEARDIVRRGKIPVGDTCGKQF